MKKNTSTLKLLSVLLILSICFTARPAQAFAYYEDAEGFSMNEFTNKIYQVEKELEEARWLDPDGQWKEQWGKEEHVAKVAAAIRQVHEETNYYRHTPSPYFSRSYGLSNNEWNILSNEKKAELQETLDVYMAMVRWDAVEESLKRDPSGRFLWDAISNAERRAQDNIFWEWWDGLSSAEQMMRINADWAIHSELGRMAQERAVAEAAAKTAAQAAIPIKLVVNGRTIATDSPPVIEDGRTLASVRAVVEALGYTVAWDSSTQILDVYDTQTHYHRISMRIGSNRVKVSTGIWGVMDEKTIDVPAKIINGRTMGPVRFIAETLGCTVGWDEATKTVTITHNAG
jgi:hypothetical protein